MNNPIGYLRKEPDRLVGTRGTHYDYVTAANGLFLEAQNDHIAARIQVGVGTVRGLAPLEPFFVMKHGLIPSVSFTLAFNEMGKDISKELFVAVVWEDNPHPTPGRPGWYKSVIPNQDASTGALRNIEKVPNTVLDMHSHGRIGAYFSGTDDGDEVGFQAYGVVGHFGDDDVPHLRFRVGIYGVWMMVPFNQVFDGSPSPCVDLYYRHDWRAKEEDVDYQDRLGLYADLDTPPN